MVGGDLQLACLGTVPNGSSKDCCQALRLVISSFLLTQVKSKAPVGRPTQSSPGKKGAAWPGDACALVTWAGARRGRRHVAES